MENLWAPSREEKTLFNYRTNKWTSLARKAHVKERDTNPEI